VIEDAYRRASRILTRDLSRTYAEYLAARKPDLDAEDALLEAHADIAALGLLPDLKLYVDREADKLAKAWLDNYRVAIKRLSDERQEAYRLLRAMSIEPQDIDLVKPKSWMEPTVAHEKDGSETPLPTYQHHLLCSEDGTFPAEMNAWEIEVLNAEMQRKGFKAWYRNPSRSSQDSLGIAFTDVGRVKDFVLFFPQSDGTIAADIVDPHGTQLSDALPKLRGLAHYAETHSKDFRRIETIAKVGETLRVLDLTSAEVRETVLQAGDAKALYESDFATNY
jgi:type III restriction enzyme